MGKKRRKKKRSNVTDLKAIYNRGMQLYLEEENYVAALKYLFKAAKAGYKKAYGEIGIILYREKDEADKEEADVESEVDTCRGRIWKERGVKGKWDEYAMLENIDVASLDQNTEALSKSKAKVIFFQEHTSRKDEKKLWKLRWRMRGGQCTWDLVMRRGTCSGRSWSDLERGEM